MSSSLFTVAHFFLLLLVAIGVMVHSVCYTNDVVRDDMSEEASFRLPLLSALPHRFVGCALCQRQHQIKPSPFIFALAYAEAGIGGRSGLVQMPSGSSPELTAADEEYFVKFFRSNEGVSASSLSGEDSLGYDGEPDCDISTESCGDIPIDWRKATKRNQGQFRWDRAPQYLTTPRGYHDVVAIDGMVFVLGGCQHYNSRIDTNCPPSFSFDIFNVRNDAWLRSDMRAAGDVALISFGSTFAVGGSLDNGAPAIYIAPAGSGRPPAEADDYSHLNALISFYAMTWPDTSVNGNLVNQSKIAIRQCDFKMSVPRYAATFFSHGHHIYIVGGVQATTGYPALSFEQHAMCCNSLGTCPDHAEVLFYRGRFAEDILLLANASILSPILYSSLGSVMVYGNIRMIVMASSSTSCRLMYPLGTVISFRSARLVFHLGDVMTLSIMRCDESIVEEVAYPPPLTAEEAAMGEAAGAAALIARVRPKYRFASVASNTSANRNEPSLRAADFPSSSSDASPPACLPHLGCTIDSARGGLGLAAMAGLQQSSRPQAQALYDGSGAGAAVYPAIRLDRNETPAEAAAREDYVRRNGIRVVPWRSSQQQQQTGNNEDVVTSPPPPPPTATTVALSGSATVATSRALATTRQRTLSSESFKFHTICGGFVSHRPTKESEADSLAPLRDHTRLRRALRRISRRGQSKSQNAAIVNGSINAADDGEDDDGPSEVSFHTSSVGVFSVPPRGALIYDQYIAPLNRTRMLVCSFFGGCELSGVAFDLLNGAAIIALSGNIVALGGVGWGDTSASVIAGRVLDVAPMGSAFGKEPEGLRYIMPNDALIKFICAPDSFLCQASIGLVMPYADVNCMNTIENVKADWLRYEVGSAINATGLKRPAKVTLCGSRLGCPLEDTEINVSDCWRKQSLDPSLCIMRDMCPRMGDDGESYCCERPRIGPSPVPLLSFTYLLSAQNIDILPYSAPAPLPVENWFYEGAPYVIIVVYAACGALVILCGFVFLRIYALSRASHAHHLHHHGPLYSGCVPSSASAGSSSLPTSGSSGRKGRYGMDLGASGLEGVMGVPLLSSSDRTHSSGGEGGRSRRSRRRHSSSHRSFTKQNIGEKGEDSGAIATLLDLNGDSSGGSGTYAPPTQSSQRSRAGGTLRNSQRGKGNSNASPVNKTNVNVNSRRSHKSQVYSSSSSSEGDEERSTVDDDDNDSSLAASSDDEDAGGPLSMDSAEGGPFPEAMAHSSGSAANSLPTSQHSQRRAAAASARSTAKSTTGGANAARGGNNRVGRGNRDVGPVATPNSAFLAANPLPSSQRGASSSSSRRSREGPIRGRRGASAKGSPLSESHPRRPSAAGSASASQRGGGDRSSLPNSSMASRRSTTIYNSSNRGGPAGGSSSRNVVAVVAAGGVSSRSNNNNNGAAPSSSQRLSSRASLKRQPIYLSGYRIVDVVGEGAYGVVLSGVRRADRATVAIKFVVCQSDADRQRAMQEYRLVKRFHGCSYIVQISDLFINWEEEDHAVGGSLGGGGPLAAHSASSTTLSRSGSHSGSMGADELKLILQSPRFVCIVLEYFPAGDLKQFLQLYPDPLVPEGAAVKVLAQIATALATLHSQNPPIAHRDLKPDNVLVDAKNNRVVLSDFGLAAEVAEGRPFARAGTPLYLAPETVAGRGGKEADLWALGCIAYALATRRVGHENARVLFRELREPGVAEAMRLEMRHYSNEYADLALALLSFEPLMRPAAANVAAMCGNMARTLFAEGSASASASAPSWMDAIPIVPARQMEALVSRGLIPSPPPQ